MPSSHISISRTVVNLHNDSGVSWVPGECPNVTSFSRDVFKLFRLTKIIASIDLDSLSLMLLWYGTVSLTDVFSSVLEAHILLLSAAGPSPLI